MASEPRVFFDADALIAGLHSPTGGAGFLLSLAAQGVLTAIASPQILIESRRNMEAKIPRSIPRLDALETSQLLEMTTAPDTPTVMRYLHLADSKDAPVVAAAVMGRAGYLVTFNLRDYRQDAIQAKLGISVLRPSELIAELRSLGII